MTTHHNTTHETGALLEEYRQKAKIQEALVMHFYRKRKGYIWSPSQVHKAVFKDNTPLTSTRRAITNLTTQGYLVKTEQKRIGDYNRPEYLWGLNLMGEAE